MPTHTLTLTTTAAQETVLNRVLTVVNQKREAESKPVLTADEFMILSIREVVLSHYNRIVGEDHDSLRDAWLGATDTQRAQIRTILGL